MESGPSETTQETLEEDCVAFLSASADAVLYSGSPTVETDVEHDVLSCSPSPLSEVRRPKQRESDPSYPTPRRLRYRWNSCAMVNVAPEELLGLGPPALQRMEIKRLHTML